MKLWIARDKMASYKDRDSYDVWIYTEKPYLSDIDDKIFGCKKGDCWVIKDGNELFPDLTFENSPKQVELKIID